MRRALMVALVTLPLVGCVAKVPPMQHATHDAMRQKQDQYECELQATTVAGGGGLLLIAALVQAQRDANRLYQTCLELRGWTVVTTVQR